MSWRKTLTILAMVWWLPIASAATLPRTTAPIKAQSVAAAIAEVAGQTGIQVVYFSEITDGLESSAAEAGLTAAQALSEILSGTNLGFEFINGNTARIYLVVPNHIHSDAIEYRSTEVPAQSSETRPPAEVAAGPSGKMPNGANPHVDPAYRRSIFNLVSDSLKEILVTAEKRDSTVQKTPISMTAFSGDALASHGIVDLLEVADEAPGLSFRTSGSGQNEYEVRGLASSGGATATVGFYYDDIPISPPAIGDIGKIVIDPSLYDLNRVEILRGPQGTLYGAGSMGGTIKVITNPAGLNQFDTGIDTTYSLTQSGGNNWAVNAFQNFPLVSDLMALRFVVSSSKTDGWIDRIVVSPFPMPKNQGCTASPSFYGCARGDVVDGSTRQVIAGVNWQRFDSARMNVMIQPGDALKITAIAMYQGTRTGGYSQFDAPYQSNEALAHYQPFNTPEPSSDHARLAGITVNYDFPTVRLTSATSYWNRTLSQFQDLSESTQNIAFLPMFYPDVGNLEQDSLAQFSQELRLASSGTDPFQWIAGGYYSDLRSEWDQTYINAAAARAVYDTGAYLPITDADNPQGEFYVARIPYDMKQYAIFSELSYQLTPALKLSAGARYYEYDSAVNASQAGLFAQSVSAVPTRVSSSTSANGYNPKVNLAYMPGPDLTLYGTVAKGFRPGGVNLPLPSAGPLSCSGALAALHVTDATNYASDSVWSYEVGEKIRLNDGRITVNGALYFIRWNDIQQLIPLSCGYFITENAGDARSYGSELEVHARITPVWGVTLSGAYTNAVINDPTPNLGIAPGTPVLNIPKYTASAAATYTRPIGAVLSLDARIAASYTGSVHDEAYAYVELPSYTLLDARIGIASARWSVYLTGVNLTNKVAELSANNTSFTLNVPDLTRISTNQPRTMGINLSSKF